MPIEIYARLQGSLQFECPECGNLNSPGKGSFVWRKGRVQCKRCEKGFQIGLGFASEGSLRCLFLGDNKTHIVNRVNPIATNPYHPLGRVYGALDWQCPQCQVGHKDFLDWYHPLVTCCGKIYLVQLLLYKIGHPKKIITPYDWTVLFHVQPTHDHQSPLSAAENHPGTGEAS